MSRLFSVVKATLVDKTVSSVISLTTDTQITCLQIHCGVVFLKAFMLKTAIPKVKILNFHRIHLSQLDTLNITYPHL